MAPVAKKQKLESVGKERLVLRQEATSVIKEIKEILHSSQPGDENLAGVISSISCKFMKLKSLQQNVLDQMKETQTILERQRKERNDEELKLENLKYQKALNEHALEQCAKLESSQLSKLCSEELNQPELESAEAIQMFLGADPNELEQRSAIIAKLNKEVSTRASLETELKICQHKAATLKQSLAAKRKLLQELPLKLHDVERASQPLQKFCQKSLNASRKLGSKRRTCLELAKSLPKPLYTLFYQLQSYLDTLKTDNASTELPSLEITNESSSVLLKIPIQPVASTATKTKRSATVQFEYDEKLGMMMAQASAAHEMAELISELFPGDTGEWTGDDNNNSQKRAYHWCNYLAGLHIVPEEHSTAQVRISTRVIVQALLRRVRALTTLNWLIHNHSRKTNPLPIHASMKDQLSSPGNDNVKLSGWTEQANDELGPKVRNYQATLKRRSQTLVVDIAVDFGRYPSLPPLLKFSQVVSSSNSTSGKGKGDNNGNEEAVLYDDKLAALERRVNYDVRELVSSSDENSCEWILSHQLAEVANGWDAIQEQEVVNQSKRG